MSLFEFDEYPVGSWYSAGRAIFSERPTLKRRRKLNYLAMHDSLKVCQKFQHEFRFCSKLIKSEERQKSRQANLGKTGAAMQARKRKCINYTYVDLRTFQKNSFRVSRAWSYLYQRRGLIWLFIDSVDSLSFWVAYCTFDLSRLVVEVGKSPNQEIGFGKRGCLEVLNDTKLVLHEHESPP